MQSLRSGLLRRLCRAQSPRLCVCRPTPKPPNSGSEPCSEGKRGLEGKAKAGGRPGLAHSCPAPFLERTKQPAQRCLPPHAPRGPASPSARGSPHPVTPPIAAGPSCLKFTASGTRSRSKYLPAESVLLASDRGRGCPRTPPRLLLASPFPLPGCGERGNPKQGQTQPKTPLLVPCTEFHHPSSLRKCFLRLCPPQIKPAPPRPCCSVLCSPGAEQNPAP